jgi:hypothetical protein
MMTLFSADGGPLMQVHAIERQGSDLLVRGKAFGTMPVTARLTPAEARKGLQLLGFRLLLFLLTLPLRKRSSVTTP